MLRATHTRSVNFSHFTKMLTQQSKEQILRAFKGLSYYQGESKPILPYNILHWMRTAGFPLGSSLSEKAARSGLYRKSGIASVIM